MIDRQPVKALAMLRIVKSVIAKSDLIDIADYYEKVSGMALAERFLNNIESAFELLFLRPGVGALRTFGLDNFRMWQIPEFEAHLIFHRSTETELQIVRVLHGIRNLDPLLSRPKEL